MSRFILLLAVVVSAVIAHPPDEVPNYLKQAEEEILYRKNLNSPEFRLPTNTYPIHYDLWIKSFRDSSTPFQGEVKVTFKSTEFTKNLVVNFQNMNFTESRVYKIVEDGENEELSVVGDVDYKYEKLEFMLRNEEFNPDETYLLYIRYDGTVHTDMRGFYESYYFNNAKSRINLYTTHFGQQARRLVPSWDETPYKATWTIKITRNYRIFSTSISNAMLESTEPDPADPQSLVIDTYKTTAPIPTYILAIVVAEFTARSDKPIGDHKYAIYARPNAANQTEFAYDNLIEIVKALDDWTGLSYFEFHNVDKIDMAAIPDFSAGAMENWGLLIHREVNILVGEGYTNSIQKFRIADVISHEAAHQW